MSHSIGILFIVATPIGNRTDISARALDTLRTVSSVSYTHLTLPTILRV